MAGKLGADFNASQPSDDDLVKKGAQWFRDTKQRLKSWAGVRFNLETGDFLDNVIEASKLKTLNPSPVGTWRSVTVTDKGLVTAGTNPNVSGNVSPYQVSYNLSGGLDVVGGAIVGSGGVDGDGLNVRSFSFVVPAGVDKIFVQVIGAGGGGGYNASATLCTGGAGGAYAEGFIAVSEGDTFLVWVGEGGDGATSGPTPAVKGAMTKFEFSAFKYLRCPGGTEGTSGAATPVYGGSPDIAGYTGIWASTGGPGYLNQGGASGRGTPPGSNNLGPGGEPSTASPALAGGDGMVLVKYWKNAS